MSSKQQHKILILRFHALGDLIAILPYVNGLRIQFPNARIDLLTTEMNQIIPDNLDLFDRVIGAKGKKRARVLFFWTMLKIPFLFWQKYDTIIDLQGDRKSKVILSLLAQKTRSGFEKCASKFAGLRYQEGINSQGFNIEADFNLKLKKPDVGLDKLIKNGYHSQEKLIVINPAGFYTSRNWPLVNYLELIAILQKKLTSPFKILLLGDNRIVGKANIIKKAFPEITINLAEQTSMLEAFTILSRVDLVVSEDSGLGHMTWVQGVKTIFLFGSTRADWTAPPYDHVLNLTSSDLECGDCMLAQCKFDDVRCLTRYTPDYIYTLIEQQLKDKG